VPYTRPTPSRDENGKETGENVGNEKIGKVTEMGGKERGRGT